MYILYASLYHALSAHSFSFNVILVLICCDVFNLLQDGFMMFHDLCNVDITCIHLQDPTRFRQNLEAWFQSI